jgi:hypothetical protein
LHFEGAAREVVGFLDKLASNDPERFVWCEVAAIVKRCRRYKAHAYNKRIVEYVLAELRSQHIISRQLTRKRRVGAYVREVPGFIVAPHDALAVRTKNVCEFVGQGHAPGAWECDPGVPESGWWTASEGAVPGADEGAVPGADEGADQKAKGADEGADES